MKKTAQKRAVLKNQRPKSYRVCPLLNSLKGKKTFQVFETLKVSRMDLLRFQTFHGVHQGSLYRLITYRK